MLQVILETHSACGQDRKDGLQGEGWPSSSEKGKMAWNSELGSKLDMFAYAPVSLPNQSKSD